MQGLISVPLPLAAVGIPLAAAPAAYAHPPAATSACAVAIEPANAPPAWVDAVRGLRLWLSGPAAGAVDCGGIEVHAEGPYASIVFTTADGRLALRPVPAPDQLLAVVEALTFTVSPPPVGTAASEPTASQARGADSVDPGQDTPRDSARTGGQSTHAFIDGWSGTRVLQPTPCSSKAVTTCAFAALSLGVGVGVNVGRWELGVAGQYEPAHATLSGAPPADFTMSAYAVGLWAGRRVPVGKMDAITGVTAAIALTEESNEDSTGQQQGTQQQGSFSQAEPRAGVFAGLVVPRRASLRVRPQIAFDVVPSHLGSTWNQPNSPLPALPWWSASASVGIEWEAP